MSDDIPKSRPVTPGYSEMDLCPSCLQIHGTSQPCRNEPPVARDSAGDETPIEFGCVICGDADCEAVNHSIEEQREACPDAFD